LKFIKVKADESILTAASPRGGLITKT